MFNLTKLIMIVVLLQLVSHVQAGTDWRFVRNDTLEAAIISIDAFGKHCGNFKISRGTFNCTMHKYPKHPTYTYRPDDIPGNSSQIPSSNSHTMPCYAKLSIEAAKGSKQCIGTIIHKNLVITAASCLFVNGLKASTITVTADTEKIVAERWTMGDDYTPSRIHNDIAVIKLSTDLVYSEKVQPACMELAVYRQDAYCSVGRTGSLLSIEQAGFATERLSFLPAQNVVVQPLARDTVYPEDIGSGLICNYCWPSGTKPSGTRAHVVGVLNARASLSDGEDTQFGLFTRQNEDLPTGGIWPRTWAEAWVETWLAFALRKLFCPIN